MSTVKKSIKFHSNSVKFFGVLIALFIVAGFFSYFSNENYKVFSYSFFSLAGWALIPLVLAYRNLSFLKKNQMSKDFIDIKLPDGYILAKK